MWAVVVLAESSLPEFADKNGSMTPQPRGSRPIETKAHASQHLPFEVATKNLIFDKNGELRVSYKPPKPPALQGILQISW